MNGVIVLFLDFFYSFNELNEAQGQPAFAKTTEAIHCRLDFIVTPAVIFVLNSF